MNRCRWIVVALCVLSAARTSAQPPIVYAAASLTPVLQELMQGPAAEQGLEARLSFAASSSLARQIAAGAPADLFFSASVSWMEYLEKKELIAGGTRADLLGNSLVVIAPRRERFFVEPRKGFPFADSFAGRLALADPAHVPAGIYARQALAYLGWWPALEHRLASAPDVRAALVYVERGECAAGIAYATDAAFSSKVEVLAVLPPESHDPIVYPLAAIRGRDGPAVRRLLAFFQSAEAAAIFSGHGFTVLNTAAATYAREEQTTAVPTDEEWEVLLLSLRVGLFCVLLSLPPGVFLGWLLARREFRGKILLDGLCHLPLVLPPVVTGYLLLLLFGRRGILGEFLEQTLGIQLAFTWKGAVLASVVVGFPLMLRAVRLGIEGVDPRLERVARTLGAGPLRTFFSITLRLAFPGLLVGSLLTFARSLGEFGATITFVSNIPGQTRTLPAAIYTYLNQPGGESASVRLVVISLVVSFAALLASEWISRRMRRN